MKKITSLLTMLMLCSTVALAQATEFANKLVRVGACQAEMVPGKWYLLHNARVPNSSVTADDLVLPGGTVQSLGGFVADQGNGAALKLTITSTVDELTTEEGVSANDYMNMFVRFVAVAGVEGAYNTSLVTATGWMPILPTAPSLTTSTLPARPASTTSTW